jgi:hypothetical protein
MTTTCFYHNFVTNSVGILTLRHNLYCSLASPMCQRKAYEAAVPQLHFNSFFSLLIHVKVSILVATWSNAWVCGRSLAGIVGSNPPRWQGCLSRVSIMYLQVEVSVSGRPLVQRSPTECGVWVWSWSLDNKEVLAHEGLLRHEKKENTCK